MTKRQIVALGVVVLVVAAAAAWAAKADSTALDDLLADLDLKVADSALITGSGFIEARRVAVAPEVGGLVRSVTVAEGDRVASGQVLVVLENEALAARERQAQAAVEAARAQLARLAAGSRGEEVRRAEAVVAQAEAAAEGARLAWEAARDARDNPRQLEFQVAAAASAVAVAEESLLSAEAQSKAAQGDEARRQAALARDEARVRLDGAREMLEHLEGVRAAPLDLISASDTARARYQAARAVADGAAARLALVVAGPSDYEVRLAQATLKQAEARLQTVAVQVDELTLVAPMAGTVAEVAAKSGESAVAGAPLLRLATQAPLEVMIYVAAADLGNVAPGTSARVRVDAYPDQTFSGRVVYVAAEAEFTPRNVQTKDERASLVYGVRIRLAMDEAALKPGMPADVEIEKG